MQFQLPSRMRNQDGDIRRVGFEFEFAGLDLETVSRTVIECYGGQQHRVSRFLRRIEGARWGDFLVEIDTALLKDQGYERFLERLGFDLDKGDRRMRVEDLLERVAATVVPYEIASPPIPMNEMQAIEALRARLQSQQALGTRAALLYAFGLHINPELPALDVATILSYLRAFFVLSDWLNERNHIDPARRYFTPFINPFPEDYLRLVVDPEYQPSRGQLIEDYLECNPTRNRPLDLLPLFRLLDADRVARHLGNLQQIKARPTFHYRLPNCLIDEPGWTVAQEWNGWAMVETLAERPERLAVLARRYLEQRREPFAGHDEDWAAETARWLESQ